MGKTVKTILKVAAFAAIAAFAAPVAGAIGLSAAVGSVVGSAVVGAAMGAATNAVLGGGVLKGALMGGAAGGLGGLLGGAAQAPPATGAVTQGVTAAPAMAGVGTTPIASAAGISDTVAAATGGLSSGTALGGAAGASGLAAAAPNTIVVTPGAAASGIGAAAPSLAAVAPIASAAGISDRVAAATSPTTQQAQAQEPSGGGGGGSGFVASLPGRLGDVAKTVAPNLIASALSGNAQSEALAAQAQALEEAQRRYNTNFDLKTAYAQQLIDDAGYYNPEVFGARAAEAARVRAGVQGRNAAREAAARTGALSGQQEAIRRQAELAGGRQATADYWSAYGQGLQGRTGTRSAGINAIPLGNPPSMSDYDYRYRGAAGDVEGTAGLIRAGIDAFNYRNMNDREFDRSTYV